MLLSKYFSRFQKKEQPISQLDLIELLRRGASTGGISYNPTHVDNYDDRVEMDLCVVRSSDSFDESPRDLHICLPKQKGQRLLPVEVDGTTLFWDTEDNIMRWKPAPDYGEFTEITPWIRAYASGELRIDRAFAEINLTSEALEYACMEGADYYSWNWLDNSCAPVVFELAALFCQLTSLDIGHSLRAGEDPTASQLIFYAPGYCCKRSLSYADIPEAVFHSMQRTLLKPDGTKL